MWSADWGVEVSRSGPEIGVLMFHGLVRRLGF